VIKLFRLSVGGLFLAFSIFLFVWVLLPQQKDVRSFQIPNVDFFFENQVASSTYSFPQGTLEAKLIWTNKIHLGEQAVIELIVFSNVVQGVETLAFLDVNNLVAEARIDLPLAQLTPSGNVRQALEIGSPLRFEWRIRTDEPGTLEGQFWFYLVLVSDLDGGSIRQPVLTAPISIETISLANLPERIIILVMMGFTMVSALFFRGYRR
jgi:hypothetical protein